MPCIIFRQAVSLQIHSEVDERFVPEYEPRLEKLHDTFAKVEPFNATNLEVALKSVAAELGVKVGVLVYPVRLACTCNTADLSLYHLMEVLGKEKTLARIDRAFEHAFAE